MYSPAPRIHSVILSSLILRSSDRRGLVLWCVAGICAGIGLFFNGFRLLQRRRLILDTPFSKIRSASIGMVEVSGLAVGPYALVAPITARSCYYYRTLVWEWKQQGKNKNWVKVAGECMHVPFFIDDNTGRVLVDPRGADLDLHRDFEQEFCDSFFTAKDPAPENVRSFLARHGVVINNKIKVQEFCVKPKNSLFILGTLSENPGLDVGPQPVQDEEAIGSLFSRAVALPIHLSPAESVPLKTSEMTQQQKVAAALLKAGISSPAAWAAAGAPAATVTKGVQVLSDPTIEASRNNPSNGDSIAPAGNAFDLHPPVVLMKGTNNKTLLISWRSQQDVARSLGWQCAVMIWGGAALALLSLYLFLGIERF